MRRRAGSVFGGPGFQPGHSDSGQTGFSP